MPITSDLPKLSALETAQRIHLTIMSEMFSNMPRDNISAWLCQEASKVYGYLSQISTYRNSLLLIHRLPPELLISIFSYALPSTPLRQSFNRLEMLATICKKWRDLTHHPKFWSTIDLSWFPHSRTKRYLDMSRGAPLDITINNPEIGYQPKVELFTTASIMPRLHSLILNTRCATTVQKLVQDISAMELPSFLHTLELNVIPRWGTSQNMPVLNLPANLQPRRALRLQAVKVPFDNPVWNNLTRVEILDMNCFQDYEPYTTHEFLMCSSAAVIWRPSVFGNLVSAPNMFIHHRSSTFTSFVIWSLRTQWTAFPNSCTVLLSLPLPLSSSSLRKSIDQPSSILVSSYLLTYPRYLSYGRLAQSPSLILIVVPTLSAGLPSHCQMPEAPFALLFHALIWRISRLLITLLHTCGCWVNIPKIIL
ncbi:hypothetical protein C8Q75DRAFT_453660 [Abortiporus biennis]|nr:hypothetical protein C8Q75DRAFT_453660 [Abortiporus biennis]